MKKLPFDFSMVAVSYSCETVQNSLLHKRNTSERVKVSDGGSDWGYLQR